MRLKGKQILLGIGGSISAYKSVELMRLLSKQGAEVQVMMSDTAQHFITPLILEVLSGKPVLTNSFQTGTAMPHIQSSRKADIIVIAPATANQLAKFAYGMADDLISATILAANCPVLIAPAMNVEMWKNVLVQENVSKLRGAGYTLIGPGNGELACGEYGEGRLIDLSLLQYEIIKLLSPPDLRGKRIVVTAGSTREYADPVRFLANGSSGKMGFALAREAYYRGADVTLIAGPVDAAPVPSSIKKISVTSAAEMLKEVLKRIKDCHIFVANAAVADYRFAHYSQQKIKKGSEKLEALLLKNDDILETVSRLRKRPYVVGFALDTDFDIKNARKKMLRKKIDLMIVNTTNAVGSDEAKVILLSGPNKEKLGTLQKDTVARYIFDRVIQVYLNSSGAPVEIQ